MPGRDVTATGPAQPCSGLQLSDSPSGEGKGARWPVSCTLVWWVVGGGGRCEEGGGKGVDVKRGVGFTVVVFK